MMEQERICDWRDAWFRRSVLILAALAIASAILGFFVMPSVAPDYAAQGLWASLCRAAGVPASWGRDTAPRVAPTATQVILDRSMESPGASDSIGRGATLALNCTMCHGAQGMSVSNAPNLAGQFAEVVIKQLRDFRDGKRTSPIMQALAGHMSDRDIDDLAAYYNSLPKARNAPVTYADELPVLVRDGAPLRNIAPCIACHGSVDEKLGAPWLEGMPKAYLAAQLVNFRSGARHNDSHAQMRNMARAITPDEINEVADFYARRGPDGQPH